MTTTTLPADLRTAAAAQGAQQRVAVSYDRISKFKVDQRGIRTELTIGVDRQHETNIRASEQLGLGVIADAQRFSDNDRSASRFATKERERWVALLDLIHSGKVSHVLVWLYDRLSRNMADTEDLLEACRIGGTLIVQTAGNPVIADPNNPDDVLRLQLASMLAQYEVAKMSIRQRAAKDKAAEQGIPHGGRRRFGYEPGMEKVRESEAQVIRDIATRLLAGESLHSCARWLNGERPNGEQVEPVPTPGGGAAWTGSNLRTMMLRPHLAALRVHQGKVIGAADWPPILDTTTHEGLKHLLTDPARRTSFSNARKYLLVGLATCATCGQPLRGAHRKATGRNKRERTIYTCQSNRHIHRDQAEVDWAVEQMIVARLERIDLSGVVQDSTADDLVAALTDRLLVLQQQHRDKADELVEQDASAETVTALLGAIERKQAKVQQDLTAARENARRPQVALEGMVGSEASQAWSGASLGRKRAVLDLLCQSITLRGSQRNARRVLSADDIDIQFRDLSEN